MNIIGWHGGAWEYEKVLQEAKIRQCGVIEWQKMQWTYIFKQEVQDDNLVTWDQCYTMIKGIDEDVPCGWNDGRFGESNVIIYSSL